MKSIITIAILASLALFMSACDNENGTETEQQEKCKCPPIESHFLECEDYDCKLGPHQQTPRGYIIDEGRNINVPIYQTAGVSDENAIGVLVTNIQLGYNGLGGGHKNMLRDANNFKEVRIVEGEEYGFDPATGVVRIGVDWNAEVVQEIFEGVVLPGLIFAHLLEKNGVRLAHDKGWKQVKGHDAKIANAVAKRAVTRVIYG